MDKQGNSTYLTIDPPPKMTFRAPNPHKSSKKHYIYKPKTMRNHSKSQKNIKRHGNETRITQKIAKKNVIIKNHKKHLKTIAKTHR